MWLTEFRFPFIQISKLPKYTQLRFTVTATYPDETAVQTLGQSNLFALTDVATAAFLSKLYSIPQGLSVQHGSNQSVAEFYGEVNKSTTILFVVHLWCVIFKSFLVYCCLVLQ
jgi:hypothetical protein